MSNTTEKLAIANTALFMLGDQLLTALDNTTPVGKKITSGIFESVVKELMADDWYFNRKRILLEDMTQIYKLTVDTAPSGSWVRGATITGSLSAKTCTIVDVLSDTVYLVTEPSGDFTDGETLADATTPTPYSVDCAAGYPLVTEDLDMDQYQYGFKKPADCLYIRGIFSTEYDKSRFAHKVEGDIIYSYFNSDCYFKYNKYLTASTDVSDVTLMPLWFHRLISAKLAYMLSANITENQKIRSKAEIDYNYAYLEAKEKNGNEEGAVDWSGNNDWRDGANNELELNGNYYH